MPVLLSSAPRLLQPAPAAVRQICPYEHYSLVRIDLSDFTTSGVTVADLASKGMCKGYSATITDGTYGYCVPQSDSGCTAGQGQSGESQHGLFMRFTLDANFAATTVTTLALNAVDPDLQGFSGGAVDGNGYAYLTPAYTGVEYTGKVPRINLTNWDASVSAGSATNCVEINDNIGNDEIFQTNKMHYNDGFIDTDHFYMSPDYPNYDRILRFAI